LRLPGRVSGGARRFGFDFVEQATLQLVPAVHEILVGERAVVVLASEFGELVPEDRQIRCTAVGGS
jgi:hypothetical protein